jgi:hypothetical protein
LLALVAAVALLQGAAARAEDENDKAGRGGGRDRRADRSNQKLETVVGEVTLLRRQGGSEGNPSGSPVITVRTEQGEIIFHVGPPFYRKANDFPIEVGDVLTVTGWRDNASGYESILARTVKNGDETLEVRDATGKRLWKRPDPADDGSPFESISGTVIGFGKNAFKPDGSIPDTGENGTVLINSAEGQVFGHIGPADWRHEKGLQLAVGDSITMRAWRVDARMSNRPFVIVRSVVKGDVDLEVRTDRRKPLWKKK